MMRPPESAIALTSRFRTPIHRIRLASLGALAQ